MDVKKNILAVAGIKGFDIAKASFSDLEKAYGTKIKEVVVDASGNVVADKTVAGIQEGEALFPLYLYQENDTVLAYIFPVFGKGLWSTIYGFLSLEKDAITIREITFYKDGETPGLGAEIEKKWFQNNFKGKKIYDVKRAVVRPVQVIKGKVADRMTGRDAYFAVDGISGATMTGKGVSAFLDKWIRIYEPYFRKIREKKFNQGALL